MLETIQQVLTGVQGETARVALAKLFDQLTDRYRTQAVSSAGLVIKAGGSALAKTGAAVTHVLIDGKLVVIAAATDMAALAGTVVNATFNVYVFTVNLAGTLVTTMGTPGATRAAVKFPEVAAGVARIGAVIINPTGTGNFVGGTTPLDDATVVPNAQYINFLGPVDPNLR